MGIRHLSLTGFTLCRLFRPIKSIMRVSRILERDYDGRRRYNTHNPRLDSDRINYCLESGDSLFSDGGKESLSGMFCNIKKLFKKQENLGLCLHFFNNSSTMCCVASVAHKLHLKLNMKHQISDICTIIKT